MGRAGAARWWEEGATEVGNTMLALQSSACLLLKRSGKADGESQWTERIPVWEVSLSQQRVLGNGSNAAIEDPGTVSVRAMNKSLAAHLLC